MVQRVLNPRLFTDALTRLGLARVSLASILALALGACAHPAERALEGTWMGVGVENFDEDDVAAATGWARGTTFEFEGARLEVALPSEPRRTGTYRLAAIEDRKVTLVVLGADGSESELDLVVDDEETLRWMLEDGRALVLKRPASVR